ncbi:PIN domain-containing protein [Escherichia coli]|uniref:PIN domain-containing protein n=1 Tax=Escherichia coli TaxID=562 RepID=UPI000BE1504D|nr:PIN domain-containing protein [Escherichia coli]
MDTGNRKKDDKPRIALIDYENCSNLKGISFSDYAEIIIFIGPLQQSVVLPVNAFLDGAKITVRQICHVSKNNVDFHLVLELGRMTCCGGREHAYHIMSADKGYDGIIITLQKQGIQCSRITPACFAQAENQALCIDWVDKIQVSARQIRNMPVSVKSFNNYMKSQMREDWSETRVKEIREELLRRGVMKICDNKIIWTSLHTRKV